jgi:hypothetical protein
MVTLLAIFDLMVFITYCKNTIFYVWLTIMIIQSLFQYVYFLRVTHVKRGSLCRLLSLEVKLETYRHSMGISSQ